MRWRPDPNDLGLKLDEIWALSLQRRALPVGSHRLATVDAKTVRPDQRAAFGPPAAVGTIGKSCVVTVLALLDSGDAVGEVLNDIWFVERAVSHQVAVATFNTREACAVEDHARVHRTRRGNRR